MKRFAQIVAIVMMAAFFVFNWKFVETQRWTCTHILNCGCGPGYRAVYHGLHSEITCKLARTPEPPQ